MCKYEMDSTSIVEDTERTRFCPQTDRQTDKRTDDVKPAYPPFNFVEAGGITKNYSYKAFNKVNDHDQFKSPPPPPPPPPPSDQ